MMFLDFEEMIQFDYTNICWKVVEPDHITLQGNLYSCGISCQLGEYATYPFFIYQSQKKRFEFEN